ncbi:MAG: TrbG/VirB9 family P-type conjugative transfer protein [Ferrovum sp.]|nr:TrbG/VirB9 family P-type conjugative transfer protein [Ferrovum sp.]NDU87482.1 TrbG/VirB9 family P-type conjugative transfer protein [Ferrovum sp.]
MIRCVRFWGLAGMLCGSVLAVAGERILVQTWDPETPTTIVTLPGVPTDLQLAPHETITGLALGDTIQWRVEELPGHLFIKPLRPDLFTAGTLVTNLRVYPLILKSTTVQGPWLLRVRWVIQEPPQALSPAIPAAPLLEPVRRNEDYTIEGDAEFRPRAVFDDGRFTWIDMGHPQVLPAIFMVDDDGSRLVNYLLREPYFVVQRLMPRFILKLGGQEVTVIHRNYSEEVASHHD